LARELTKTFETFLRGSLADVLQRVSADQNQQKGEMVILVQGAIPLEQNGIDADAERVLKILLQELSVKQAASLAASITGVKKNLLYQFALKETSSK
ncbi:MAG: 16S rRNA (cytidine(1402)-2'-O)-methyltransferase, partial [Gammaproteobacteria bacterium]